MAVAAGAAGLDEARAVPVSRATSVAPACREPANVPACRVALRYLAALDLDRGRQACLLLAPSTLARAGGAAGCMRTLAAARGIRIRYSLLGVGRSPLGRVVDFTTRGESTSPVRQAMIVTPAGRILAVVPVWH